MKNLTALTITAFFLIILSRAAVAERERPSRPQAQERERPAQTEETRKLTRRLRELNQDLRGAIAEARQSEEVAKTFARVSRLRQALRKAQDQADEVLEEAIVVKNPELAEKVAERKSVRGKLQELRGRFARRGMRYPGRGQELLDTRPARPVEDSSTKDRGKRIIPTIVHFDIPADDVDRAKKFYTGLFGWKIERFPGPMEYWLISVTEDKDETAIDGGLMKRIPPEGGIRNYIAVPSVEEYAPKVKKLGGRVVLPKMAVPGFGYFAVCLDTENNCFAVWETDESAK